MEGLPENESLSYSDITSFESRHVNYCGKFVIRTLLVNSIKSLCAPVTYSIHRTTIIVFQLEGTYSNNILHAV